MSLLTRTVIAGIAVQFVTCMVRQARPAARGPAATGGQRAQDGLPLHRLGEVAAADRGVVRLRRKAPQMEAARAALGLHDADPPEPRTPDAQKHGF